MTVAVFVVAVLVVVAGGCVVWPALVWRRLVRRRVSVVLDTERSIVGVLFARRGRLLVIREAATMQGDREVRFDGEVVVDRGRILWIQVLG